MNIEKFKVEQEKTMRSDNNNVSVSISDIDVPFWSIFKFMFKTTAAGVLISIIFLFVAALCQVIVSG